MSGHPVCKPSHSGRSNRLIKASSEARDPGEITALLAGSIVVILVANIFAAEFPKKICHQYSIDSRFLWLRGPLPFDLHVLCLVHSMHSISTTAFCSKLSVAMAGPLIRTGRQNCPCFMGRDPAVTCIQVLFGVHCMWSFHRACSAFEIPRRVGPQEMWQRYSMKTAGTSSTSGSSSSGGSSSTTGATTATTTATTTTTTTTTKTNQIGIQLVEASTAKRT